MKVQYHLNSTIKFINTMLILFLLILTGSWNKRNSEARSESTFQIYLGRKNVGYLNIIHTRGSKKSRIQVHRRLFRIFSHQIHLK